ncbi:PspC domain-containing protein [bacterium SCSIO 12741]|nr:PspC domain-containing protein [bacterium SCSIO 12741]
MPKLYRSEKKMIGGVCQGLSETWNIPVIVLRLLFVGSTLFFFFPVLVYLVLLVSLPEQNGAPNKLQKPSFKTAIPAVIGIIAGFFCGYLGGLIAIGGDSSGFLVVIFFSLCGAVAGGIGGFLLGSRMVK